MADKDLYFSQMAGVDRSTMGTALETDDNGNTVRRSTREQIHWVFDSAWCTVNEKNTIRCSQ